jgi:hypothetical protein
MGAAMMYNRNRRGSRVAALEGVHMASVKLVSKMIEVIARKQGISCPNEMILEFHRKALTANGNGFTVYEYLTHIMSLQ